MSINQARSFEILILKRNNFHFTQKDSEKVSNSETLMEFNQ